MLAHFRRTTEALNERRDYRILQKEVVQAINLFSPKIRYRTLKKVPTELQSCLNSHDSKSLILTLAHPEDRRGSSYLLASAANT